MSDLPILEERVVLVIQCTTLPDRPDSWHNFESHTLPLRWGFDALLVRLGAVRHNLNSESKRDVDGLDWHVRLVEVTTKVVQLA